MAIELKILLSRNRKTLFDFCEKNVIKSYESLQAYCQHRELEPHAESEYNEIMQAHQSLEQEEDKSVELFGAEVALEEWHISNIDEHY